MGLAKSLMDELNMLKQQKSRMRSPYLSMSKRNDYSMNNMSVTSAYSVSGKIRTPLKRNKSMNKSLLSNSYMQKEVPMQRRSLQTVPQYSSGSDTKSKSSKKIANYETPKSKV